MAINIVKFPIKNDSLTV